VTGPGQAAGTLRGIGPRARKPARRIFLAAAGAVLSGAACSERFGAPDPATSQGGDVLDLWRVLMLTAIGVGGLVVSLLAVTVVRDRRGRSRRSGSEGDGLPPQTRENIPLEIAYTAIPFVIVAVLFALTLRTQRPVMRLTSDPGLRVEATGFQWGWRFLYPSQQVTVLGDSNSPPTLVLPRGVTTRMVLESPDVIHAFYVPGFLVKKDVIPGVANELDVTPTRVGRFGGYCAEFCGLDHARMTFAVEVVEPPDFERWTADQQERQRAGRTDQQDDAGGGGDPQGQALGSTRAAYRPAAPEAAPGPAGAGGGAR
jgi:cytochrome c oxidase subunit II